MMQICPKVSRTFSKSNMIELFTSTHEISVCFASYLFIYIQVVQVCCDLKQFF